MKRQFAVAEHLLLKQDGLLCSPHPAKTFIRSREMLKQHVSRFPLTRRFVAGSAFVGTWSSVCFERRAAERHRMIKRRRL